MMSSLKSLNDKQPKPSLISLLVKSAQTVALAIPSLLLLPFYLVGSRIWYRPPNAPHFAQVRRYLGLTWSAQPKKLGLSINARVWLTITIIRKWMTGSIFGSAWLLDELLYGDKMDSAELPPPFFVISGARSGSTQISRYIEEDPAVSAPNLMQCTFPYLWLWRIAPHTIGRFIPPERAVEKIESMMPAESLERHEFNPFKSDTFDITILSAHLNALSLYLGPEISSTELHLGAFPPKDKDRLEQDFVTIVDRLRRKQALYTNDFNRRFFIKGHFLFGAEGLEQRFPDADFLTIIRDPVKRLRSAINFLRVNPHDPSIGPVPWVWLTESIAACESDYCRIEQAWFSQKEGANRCVIRFDDFVNDLEGTMKTIYRDCFDQDDLPPHVPRVHPPRERTYYTVNWTLAELGINADAYRESVADYVAWKA